TPDSQYVLLQSGDIDLLMGQQTIARDAPDFLDFSAPYFVGKQVALAMANNPVNSIFELGGQNVGVVIGSPGEAAFTRWAAANGMAANVVLLVMLDDGFRALGEGQITALVGDRWELDRRVRGSIEGVKLLAGGSNEPVGAFSTEPYGIAMLRYDDNLRTLVDRTLQRLVASERFGPIYDLWFPEGLMPASERVYPRVWADIDADTRTLADFPVDVVRPASPVTPRIQAGEALKVAGLGLPPGPDGQPTILERFNTALVNEMARRWGVTVVALPAGTVTTEDMLASGAADIAVGLEPRWSTVDRIDYAGVYAERGYRMMVRVGSNIESFGGLRIGGRRTIATFADEPEAFDEARRLAVSVGLPEATIQNVVVRSGDEALEAVFETQSARVLFGDALRVVPLAAANPERVQLTPTLYGRRPLAFGVPRNDVEFRRLVETTLQDMARDGAYQRLWAENWNLGDPLPVIVWPGE
ncbi:MAG: transporter substrate-binding domain-containing protein, partial [Anaerolineae bacterium]|nr:transporter substrate-binding domain-containing protein [Anaerolineae bacterium]